MYLIGSKFVLITDHQPLLSMFNNLNSRTPARIKYWLLYLQWFDYVMEYNQVNLITLIIYLSSHFDTMLNTIRMQRKGDSVQSSDRVWSCFFGADDGDDIGPLL